MTRRRKVQGLAVPFTVYDVQGKEMLLKCASTALNAKLISSHQDLLATIIVDSISFSYEDTDLDLVAVLVKGVGSKRFRMQDLNK